MPIFGRTTTIDPAHSGDARPMSGAIDVVDDGLRSTMGRDIFTPPDVLWRFEAITAAVAGDPHENDVRRVVDDATGTWTDRVVIPAGVVVDALLDVRVALVR